MINLIITLCECATYNKKAYHIDTFFVNLPSLT